MKLPDAGITQLICVKVASFVWSIAKIQEFAVILSFVTMTESCPAGDNQLVSILILN